VHLRTLFRQGAWLLCGGGHCSFLVSPDCSWSRGRTQETVCHILPQLSPSPQLQGFGWGCLPLHKSHTPCRNKVRRCTPVWLITLSALWCFPVEATLDGGQIFGACMSLYSQQPAPSTRPPGEPVRLQDSSTPSFCVQADLGFTPCTTVGFTAGTGPSPGLKGASRNSRGTSQNIFCDHLNVPAYPHDSIPSQPHTTYKMPYVRHKFPEYLLLIAAPQKLASFPTLQPCRHQVPCKEHFTPSDFQYIQEHVGRPRHEPRLWSLHGSPRSGRNLASCTLCCSSRYLSIWVRPSIPGLMLTATVRDSRNDSVELEAWVLQWFASRSSRSCMRH